MAGRHPEALPGRSSEEFHGDTEADQPEGDEAGELAADSEKLDLMQSIIGQLDPEDLKTIGYQPDELWKPLEEAAGKDFKPKKKGFSMYSLQRKLIVRFRSRAQRQGLLRKLLKKVQLTCDVLLRE